MSTKTVTTAEELSELLRNTDDETVILRDKGGFVWVSSGYTREGIFLTLSEGPFHGGAPFSLQAGQRLAEYGPFTVVYDTRWDADGAPQGEEMVTDPHDAPSYPWNTTVTWSAEFRERVATKYEQARELLCNEQHPGLDFGAAAIVVAHLTNLADELRNP